MTRIPTYVTIAVCLLTCAARARAQVGPDLRKIAAGELTEVKHWSEVPSSIRDILVQEWKSDWIADAGEPFQATDTIGPEKLPGRRFVVAAKGPTAWLVCFETGGIAHIFHLAVFPVESGRVRAKASMATILPPAVQDLASLRKAIAEHRYRKEQTP